MQTDASLIASNVEAFLIIMPRKLASPKPTLTAVGVAKPMAQGHAITNIAMDRINVSESPTSSIQKLMAQERMDKVKTAEYEPTANLVCELLNLRLVGTASFCQIDNHSQCAFSFNVKRFNCSVSI